MVFVWQLGRYFKHLGFEVCYVRNFTDVDDKVSFNDLCLLATTSILISYVDDSLRSYINSHHWGIFLSGLTYFSFSFGISTCERLFGRAYKNNIWYHTSLSCFQAYFYKLLFIVYENILSNYMITFWHYFIFCYWNNLYIGKRLCYKHLGPVWIKLILSLWKQLMQINKLLYIIHKFVNVVYEKIVYKDTIFISENL